MSEMKNCSRALSLVLLTSLFSSGALAQDTSSDSEKPASEPDVKAATVDDQPAAATTSSARSCAVRYRPYADDAPAVEKWMHQVMDKPIGNFRFAGDTPLSEVLEFIADQVNSEYGATPEGQMKMVVYPDVGELALEQIDALEDITVSDIEFDSMQLRNVLTLVFEQTNDDARSPVPLGYVIRNEVLLVTTKDRLESDDFLVAQAYSVPHLLKIGAEPAAVAPRAPGGNAAQGGGGQGGLGTGAQGNGTGLFSMQFGGGGMGGGGGFGGGGMAGGFGGGGMAGGFGGEMMPDPTPKLVRLVVDMTMNANGDNWASASGGNGVYGEARLFGEKLIVRHTPEMQAKVVSILNLLSQDAKE